MPELRNEHPSNDELREYLNQHVPGSVFAAFFLTPEQVTAGFPNGVARAFASLRRMDGEAFAQLAYDSLLAGMERMNELPRSDPFWENTNNRPTIFKLPQFRERELAPGTGSDEALWTAVFSHIWHGPNDFGERWWLELSRRGSLDVRWPVYAALTIHLTASSTIEQLPDFLRKSKMREAAVPVIHTIAREADGDAVMWAESVLKKLC